MALGLIFHAERDGLIGSIALMAFETFMSERDSGIYEWAIRMKTMDCLVNSLASLLEWQSCEPRVLSIEFVRLACKCFVLLVCEGRDE